jgi:hypothetical protein
MDITVITFIIAIIVIIIFTFKLRDGFYFESPLQYSYYGEPIPLPVKEEILTNTKKEYIPEFSENVKSSASSTYMYANETADEIAYNQLVSSNY